MKVSTTIMNGKHGLTTLATVTVQQGHLDDGYIQLTINNLDDNCDAHVYLSTDEAEAIAMNLNLARKHAAISVRKS